MSEEKIYCGNMYQKEMEGKNGPWVKTSIRFFQSELDKLQKFVDPAKEDVWVNVTKRKTPSDKGVTHYLTIDTYKRPGDDDGLPESDLESMKPDGVEEDTSPLPF